jgi:hypothetical protein
MRICRASASKHPVKAECAAYSDDPEGYGWPTIIRYETSGLQRGDEAAEAIEI